MADGGSDFCLTSVHHYLTARQKAGPLAARFAAMIVRRSPIAALVPDDSPLREAADLQGRRVTGSPDKPHMQEFLASLAHRGLEGCEVVPMDPAVARDALARGEVDGIVEFVDAMPRIRRLAGIPLRAIPVGLDVYASGLVAGDRLSPELVGRMRQALVESLASQRANPTGGVDELRRRYPDADANDAAEGWRLVEPLIFSDDEPGSMDAQAWRRTLSFLCGARGLPVPDPETVYRPEFAKAAFPGS